MHEHPYHWEFCKWLQKILFDISCWPFVRVKPESNSMVGSGKFSIKLQIMFCYCRLSLSIKTNNFKLSIFRYKILFMHYKLRSIVIVQDSILHEPTLVCFLHEPTMACYLHELFKQRNMFGPNLHILNKPINKDCYTSKSKDRF